MKSNREFYEELAAAAVLLLELDVVAPTSVDILDAWSTQPGGAPVALLPTVQSHLKEVSEVLRALGHTVVPVSDAYYTLSDQEAEGTRTLGPGDVGKSLPVGNGKRQAGILFVTPDDEFAQDMLRGYEQWTVNAGRGRVVASIIRQDSASNAGLLSREDTLTIIGVEQRRALTAAGE